jgi:AraC-like DNA-binding protein
MDLRSFHWSSELGGDSGGEWLAAVSPIFTSPTPFPNQKSAIDVWASSSFVITQSSCDCASLVHDPSKFGRFEQVGICVILSGTIDERASGATGRLGDILLLDLREPIELVRESERTNSSEMTLWLPRSQLPDRLKGLTTLNARVVKADQPGTVVATAALRALLTQLDAATPSVLDQLVRGVASLTADVVAAAAAAQPNVHTPHAPPLESFVTLSQFIETNLTARDLGAEKLARTFGLSRASLYRLFEPVGGVASYIRMRRLHRTYQELMAPGFQNRRIGPIAYGAGFRSIPAFNRAFRATFGQPPRTTRKTQVAFPKSRALTIEEMGPLARWLSEIS